MAPIKECAAEVGTRGGADECSMRGGTRVGDIPVDLTYVHPAVAHSSGMRDAMPS